jgi:hypothetical protein
MTSETSQLSRGLIQQYDFQSEYFRKRFEEGKARFLKEEREQARLQAVRRLLCEIAGRRIGELSEARRARIDACGDAERLERLLVQIFESPDPAETERALDEL